MNFQIDSEFKITIRKELAELGVASADISIVEDLALHVVSEAGEAFIRVADTAPTHLQPYILSLATCFLHSVTKPQIEEQS